MHTELYTLSTVFEITTIYHVLTSIQCWPERRNLKTAREEGIEGQEAKRLAVRQFLVRFALPEQIRTDTEDLVENQN